MATGLSFGFFDYLCDGCTGAHVFYLIVFHLCVLSVLFGLQPHLLLLFPFYCFQGETHLLLPSPVDDTWSLPLSLSYVYGIGAAMVCNMVRGSEMKYSVNKEKRKCTPLIRVFNEPQRLNTRITISDSIGHNVVCTTRLISTL
jgi:hypothetical protein